MLSSCRLCCAFELICEHRLRSCITLVGRSVIFVERVYRVGIGLHDGVVALAQQHVRHHRQVRRLVLHDDHGRLGSGPLELL